MIYSWQTVNPANLAEQVCRPTDYFDLGDNLTILPQEITTMPDDGPVIFGASGLLYPEIAPVLERAVANKKQPMICWGIGHNTHGGTKIEYPDWLAKFDLVGLRDYRSPYLYVPCPSCMHKVFETDYGYPKHKSVVYDQIDYPIAGECNGFPRENNCHSASDFERIIAFLASGERIITTSYHGAYWGMLLNRQVIVERVWSTKFSGFKLPHRTHPDQMYFDCAAGFLSECRALNREFAERVKLVISRHLA